MNENDADRKRLVFMLPSGRISPDTIIAPGAIDGCKYVSIPADQVRLDCTLYIISSRIEGDTQIIELAQLVEVSIGLQPATPETQHGRS
jgi:hypothetical protein